MSKKWLLQQAIGTCAVLSFLLMVISLGSMIEIMTISPTQSIWLVVSIVGMVVFGMLFVAYD